MSTPVITNTVVSIVIAMIAMALAAWRIRHGLALVGDSGSYLAGASGFSKGHWFQSPLVPSFSELSLLDTVSNGGWSPFTDFGLGTPMITAVFDLVLPLRVAAGFVNVLAIGFIAAAIMVGPWSPQRSTELLSRSILAISVSCWPILRFTGVAVLSEPVFCATILWLAIILARLGRPRFTNLISLGALTMVVGFTRFIGPVVAVVVAILLIQRGLSWLRAGSWALATGLIPSMVTAWATGGTRTRSFHSRDSDDIFFLARGVGGWFEAGMGDQTSTLLRLSFQPSLLDWMIAVASFAGAIWVLWCWLRPGKTKRQKSEDLFTQPTVVHAHSQLEPALVLATTLALAVIPAMFFLDAILKLENRIMMPSGILIISAGGWWLASRTSPALALGGVCLWSIVATHPWNWAERPSPSEPTRLTTAVSSLGAKYVITNQADLVWWHTSVPARYLPTGYFDRSARFYDPLPIMVALPCALAQNGGAIVIDTDVGLPSVTQTQLSNDVAAGHYDVIEIEPGVIAYMPTALNCTTR